MRRCVGVMAALIWLVSCGSKPPEEQKAGPAVATSAAACALPAAMAGSNEQTAWQIFVAANCPAAGKLTWETWTEQTCFQNPDSAGCSPVAGLAATAAAHHLHGSGLARALRGREAAVAGTTPGPCQPMVTSATAKPVQKPFVPKNVTSTAQFCEEVFVDPAEAGFVKAPTAGATLTNLTAQVKYAGSTAITFPTPAVELKVDWLPASSLNPPFDCGSKAPAGVYTETIDNVCYAMVSMHVSSKLLPNWLWSTFEPQNKDTNPNRCDPKLYNSCNDPWGSNPATSTGDSTEQTPALKALMTQAGLAPALFNYRMVATQSAYLDAGNQPVQLGNSFTEFNAGVLPHEASCMTCHSYAMVSTTANENPNFGNFKGTPPIGTPGAAPLPAQGGGTWVQQDFSWMLGIMPKTPPTPGKK